MKTHTQLAKEIEQFEACLNQLDIIAKEQPIITIRVVASEDLVINERQDELAGFIKTFYINRIEERKKEVIALMNSKGESPVK